MKLPFNDNKENAIFFVGFGWGIVISIVLVFVSSFFFNGSFYPAFALLGFEKPNQHFELSQRAQAVEPNFSEFPAQTRRAAYCTYASKVNGGGIVEYMGSPAYCEASFIDVQDNTQAFGACYSDDYPDVAFFIIKDVDPTSTHVKEELPTIKDDEK